MLPVIFGLSGPRLTADEQSFFKDANPAGYILFARNIEHPEQLRALTDSLRNLAGRDDLPILIDQEGGRIARLGAAASGGIGRRRRYWPACPPRQRRRQTGSCDRQGAMQLRGVGAGAGGNGHQRHLRAGARTCPSPTPTTLLGIAPLPGRLRHVAKLGRACLAGLQRSRVWPA